MSDVVCQTLCQTSCVRHRMSDVMCWMSYVRHHVSDVVCQMSYVGCHDCVIRHDCGGRQMSDVIIRSHVACWTLCVGRPVEDVTQRRPVFHSVCHTLNVGSSLA